MTTTTPTAPLPAQPEQSVPTDLSKRLRDYANSGWMYANNVVKRTDLLAACDEIDRYYGGMMAWKQTAEKKDLEVVRPDLARLQLYRCSSSGMLPAPTGKFVLLSDIEALFAAAGRPAGTEPWTDEQREHYRKNGAQVHRCTICCVQPGDEHFPGCSKARSPEAQ